MIARISCSQQLIAFSQRLLLDSLDMLPNDGGERMDEPTSDEREFKAECCLFVANLPQDLSNSQLAYALFETFHAMLGAVCSGSSGAMRSIKASRDSRMRPFGFVEFDSASTAEAILECARRLPIWMSGRKLRIEPARSQHRLKIRVPLEESTDVFREQAKIYQELCGAISPQYIRVLPPQSGPGGMCLVYVVKFDRPNEELVCSWSSRRWQVQRMTDGSLADNASLNTRNSGLVHLVIPENWQGNLGNGAFSSSMHQQPAHNYYHHHYYHPMTIISTPPASPDTPPFEELNLQASNRLASCSESSGAAHGSLPGDIYVGRLNSRQVTTGELAERFGVHGKLAYVRLYNRLAVGVDGGKELFRIHYLLVPIDSHAFIRFNEASAAESAIEGQNRATWHGQTIKCEKARPVLATDDSWRVIEDVSAVN